MHRLAKSILTRQVPRLLAASAFVFAAAAWSGNARSPGSISGVEPISAGAASVAIADTDVTATLPDVAFTTVTSRRTTIYVAQRCGSVACVDSDMCGTTKDTACLTLHAGIKRLLSVPKDPTVVGADVLEVAYGDQPYYAAHTFEDSSASNGSTNNPKLILGKRSASGLPPKIIADQSQVPLEMKNGYWSGGPKPDKDGTWKNQSAAFTVASSRFWRFQDLEIDCANAPDTASPVNGFFIVGADHVSIAGVTIRRCAGDAIEVRGSSDVLVEKNLLVNNEQAKRRTDGTLERLDANATTISRTSQRVWVRENVAYGNTGDGVQCQGRENEDPELAEYDSSDITIEGNTFHGNDENAVDIKSCSRVTIKGSNVFYNFFEDITNGGNGEFSCGGAAVVIHYNANKVLVDGARIFDAGIGVAVGNEHYQVSDVVIRRNTIYDLNQNPNPTHDRVNCGDGIQIHRARNVDIYHNTIDNAPHSGIEVGVESSYALPSPDCAQASCAYSPAENVRVWNNIVSNVASKGRRSRLNNNLWNSDFGGALAYNVDNAPGLYSQVNLVSGTTGSVWLSKWTGLAPRTLQQLTLSQWQTNMPTSVEAQGNLDNPPSGSTPGTFEAQPLFVGEAYYLDGSSVGFNQALADNSSSGLVCGAGPDLGARESDCTSSTSCSTDSNPAPGFIGGLTWGVQTGTCNSDYYRDVAVGPDGSVIAVGGSRGSFGYTNQGGLDAVVKRYTVSGGNGWTRQLGSLGEEYATGVAIDSTGNVYVVGSTTGSLSGASHGNSDGFIAKYNSSGTRLWVRQFGSLGNEQPQAVIVNSAGSAFVVGSLNPVYTWDGETQVAMSESRGFVAGFSSDGNQLDLNNASNELLWVSSGDQDRFFSAAIDTQNNLIIGGETSYSGASWMIKFAFENNTLVERWHVTEEFPEPTLGARAVAVAPDNSIWVSLTFTSYLESYDIRETSSSVRHYTADGIKVSGESASVYGHVKDMKVTADGFVAYAGFGAGDGTIAYAEGTEKLVVGKFKPVLNPSTGTTTNEKKESWVGATAVCGGGMRDRLAREAQLALALAPGALASLVA